MQTVMVTEDNIYVTSRFRLREAVAMVAQNVIVMHTNIAENVLEASLRQCTPTDFVFQAKKRQDMIRVIFHKVRTIIQIGSFSHIHSCVMSVLLNTVSEISPTTI